MKGVQWKCSEGACGKETQLLRELLLRTSEVVKAKFHYASWFEAGLELVRSWSQTYSKLKFGLSPSLLAAN